MHVNICERYVYPPIQLRTNAANTFFTTAKRTCMNNLAQRRSGIIWDATGITLCTAAGRRPPATRTTVRRRKILNTLLVQEAATNTATSVRESAKVIMCSESPIQMLKSLLGELWPWCSESTADHREEEAVLVHVCREINTEGTIQSSPCYEIRLSHWLMLSLPD
jgi:hypothetical protein